MDDQTWHKFFTICATTLGKGDWRACDSQSWCGWTAFSKLREEFHYWSAGLPGLEELTETYIKDGGTWGQPFSFCDIAHIVIPRQFYWERTVDRQFTHGMREQDINTLSARLTEAGIAHRCTDLVLEIKLY
ncbi:MAG TPA: hypothetical protein VN229_02075 [Terriglobales bacterium]|nr:hypothetical protein [Terriglobales bacterium]